MNGHKSVHDFCKKHLLKFENFELIERALTHSSFVNEHRSEEFQDNERLEFLGDAVLELAMSEFLFKTYSEYSEGEMTKLRAQHVCEAALVTYATNIHLGDYLRLGKGEEISGGRQRPALIADAFEAVLGAIYLSLGYKRAYRFLSKEVFPFVKDGHSINVIDYKSKLQELVQTDSNRSVQYQIVSEIGPAHNKTFVAEVYMDEIKMGSGEGRSKKEAEQQAAKVALELMANDGKDKNKIKGL